MKFCLLIWSWACLSYHLTAQNTDTTQANTWLMQGHEFYRELKDYQNAAELYLKAGNTFKIAGFPERYAYCLTRRGLCDFRTQKYQNALEWFQKGLTIYDSLYPEDHSRLISPNTRVGSAYTAMGNHYSALEHFRRAAELSIKFKGPQHQETGVALYNLGTSLMNFGEYQEGMQAYQQTLSIYLQNSQDGINPRLSNLYVNMGILYDKRGEAEKALEYYHKSSQIDSTLYGNEYYLLAYNYYNTAISLVNIKKYQDAEQFYHRTIDLSIKNQIYLLLASAHYGLGNLAKIDEDYNSAEGLYLEAIGLFRKHLGPQHPDINHSYRGLAEIYQNQHAYDKAEEYLKECLALLQTNFGESHPWIARTYQQMANLHETQNQFDQATKYLELGFEALLDETGEAGSRDHKDHTDKGIFMGLLRDYSSILQSKYHRGGKNLEDLRLAFESFKKAIQVIDDIRRGYILDNSKVFLQEEAFTTYEQAIECGYELYRIEGDIRLLDEIHQIIEKSKATVLAEAMQGNKLQNINGVPDSILEMEMQLKKNIGYVESSLSDSQGVVRDSLEQSLFNLHLRYDTLSEYLSVNYPHYWSLKYNIEVVTASQFQNKLSKEMAVLNYFLGDQNWYVFVFDREDQYLIKIDSAERVKLDLSSFRSLLSDMDRAKFTESPLPYQLYRELVAKPLSFLSKVPKRLVVVPHGYLAHLPFGALLTKEPTENSKLPYLVYQQPISYTPSLTLQHYKSLPDQLTHTYRGYAPNYSSSGSDQLPPLPGTREEVYQANHIFKGQVYLDAQATENLFKSYQGGARVLHLAMHALIDDLNPMNSRLMFAPQNDSLEDGALHAHEIYNLQIPSELAVLSACNTGYGEIARGEGVMNLSRAFQYAGSPNIVMSLWQASDEPTAQIMNAFFKKLKSGVSKDRALQQAKIEYLEQADPFESHPGQWATFILIGDPAPLSLPNYRWKWSVLVGTFVMLLIWYLNRARQKGVQETS